MRHVVLRSLLSRTLTIAREATRLGVAQLEQAYCSSKFDLTRGPIEPCGSFMGMKAFERGVDSLLASEDRNVITVFEPEFAVGDASIPITTH